MPVHRQQLSRPQRSSNFIVKSVGHYSEWLIDKVATASIGVAPLALVAGIYSTAIGYWLLTIGFFIVTVLAAVGIFARFIAPWQLRVKRLAPADLGSFINPKSQIANRSRSSSSPTCTSASINVRRGHSASSISSTRNRPTSCSSAAI